MLLPIIATLALFALVAGFLLRARSARLRARDRRFLDRLRDVPAPSSFPSPPSGRSSLLLQSLISERLRQGLSPPAFVELKLDGTFRPKPGGKWVPFTALQTLVPPRGFLWKATITAGPLRIAVSDHYWDGQGAVEFSLFGLLPLGAESGSDIAKSALGRLLLETFWMPSALLDEEKFAIDQVSERLVRAKHKPSGQTFDLHFDPSGFPTEVIGDRWGDPAKSGTFHWVPFGGRLSVPRNFDGITIPTEVRGGWWYGSERYFEFYRARVVEAKFFEGKGTPDNDCR